MQYICTVPHLKQTQIAPVFASPARLLRNAKMYIWLKLIFTCSVSLQACSAARILVYVPGPFYSHQITYRPLWKELANRGHNLTLLTPNPMESHENITQIDLSAVYSRLEEANYYEVQSNHEENWKGLTLVLDLMIEMTDIELSQPSVQRLIKGDERFDLVITEFYLIIGAAFAHRFKCPFIGVVSMDGHINTHNIIGNPTHPILYPPAEAGMSGKLSFTQRLISTLFYPLWYMFLIYMHNGENLVMKHFGDDFPSIYDLQKNIGMLFINSNPVFHTVRPLTSRTVNVGGGLHIERPKPLPKDIQDLLHKSKGGVIYFSLGTNIRSSKLSNKTKSVIIEAFSQLPYQILWKFEEDVNGAFFLPKNVHAMKWLPQQDVLRHPNVKLFVTQGGLQSSEEALFIGVPVLVLPFWGDQIVNAQKAVEYGFGLSLNPKTLEVAEFNSAILEIITSRRFKESAVRLGKQLLDRPWTGVEQAAWWTEYVLRNPDISILKHPNSEIPLYQYLFLDVILFCVCFCIALVFCTKLVFRAVIYIFHLLRGSRKIKKQ